MAVASKAPPRPRWGHPERSLSLVGVGNGRRRWEVTAARVMAGPRGPLGYTSRMEGAMTEPRTTINGSAQAEISRRLVQIMKEHTGRGPTRARTTVSDDLVVCVMRAGF